MKSGITIGVPPDYKHLFAEVAVETKYKNKNLLVEFRELNTENGELTVKFYSRDDGNDWTLSYQDLIDLLEKAKAKLLGETR